MQRRDFMKGTAAAAAAGPFVGNVLGANDRIRVGQIGCGVRGQYEISICGRNPQVEVAAVCDVFQPAVEKGRKMQPKADGYGDFRKVLERKDIDAVFVSAPDHWHALITVLACQAGKDVYCEKPLSLTIDDGRKMVQAARKYDRIVQTGSQQRSAPHFQKAVELISGGHIGKVSMVECWNVGNESPFGIGNPRDEAPPKGLDWDMYLGPAPKRPYNRNRFIWNYRWFWDYSGGMMTDWGAHHMDIVQWAMGVDAPVAVSAAGGRFVNNDNAETPDTFEALFEYPGFVARYWNRKANGFPFYENLPYGMLFYGTEGTLFLDRTGFRVMAEMGSPKQSERDWIKDQSEAVAPMPTTLEQEAHGRQSYPATATRCKPIEVTGIDMEPAVQDIHVQHFLDSIRSRKLPNADVETGHRSVTACHLGVIAYRVGRKIRWDREREMILDDPAAQAMTKREYRAPWKLEV